MEPLRLAFTVACAPERAFSLWAEQTSRWWPHGHSVSGAPGLAVTFEPRVGGRIFERAPDGAEHDWGEVLAWEPPRRLAYLWHLRFDRADATEVEVTFTPSGEGTAVRIEHRGWERLGSVAEARRDRNRQGWGAVTPRFRVAAMVSDPIVVDWTAPPGAGWIAPLHVHHEDDEAWLVLDGALGVRLGDGELRIGPGEHVVMPPGTPHTYRNVHEGPTRYLLAMTPRIQRLIDALRAGGDPEETFREHRSSVAAARPA